MARIAGIDLPRNKIVEIALTYIHGIGRSTARKILQQAQVDFTRKTDQLTDAEVAKIREALAVLTDGREVIFATRPKS